MKKHQSNLKHFLQNKYNFWLNKVISIIVSLLFLSIFIVFGVWKLVIMPYLKAPMNPDAKPLYYDFKKGSNLYQITKDLNKKGLITHPKYLIIYAKFFVNTRDLNSGIYKIDPKKSPLDLLNILSTGKIAAFNLRTNRGNTFKQMMIGLNLEDRLTHDLKGLTPEKIMQKIGYAGKPYEGYFFPDTYSIPYQMTETDFLKKSYKSMRDILDNVWQNRDENIKLKNKHELLTLASIIEKEAAVTEEMPIISSVFHNRLKKEMRLQTDPTVIYGMGDKYHGNITKKDLKTKTAYNTYRINGLPPTPIAIPSLAALESAAHPDNTNFLYFVSKGNGRHYFSATYKEHRLAVNKYQKRR